MCIKQKTPFGDFFSKILRDVRLGLDHLKGIADVLARRQPATLVILPDIPDRRVHPGLPGVDGADAILDGLLAKECFLRGHPRANTQKRGVVRVSLKQQAHLGLGFLPLALLGQAEDRLEFPVVGGAVLHPIAEAKRPVGVRERRWVCRASFRQRRRCILLRRLAPGRRRQRQANGQADAALGQVLPPVRLFWLVVCYHAAAA